MTPSSDALMPAPIASAPRTAIRIGVILAAWFAVIVWAGVAGVFVSGPARPPLPLLAALVIPPALFALAYNTTRRVRAWALNLDLRVLTAIEAWRVIGGVFLAFYAYDLLPGIFAWPAGIGDMAVGVAAVFVLRAMLRGAPNWRHSVLWLNIAGLVDFVGAIGTGALMSNSALGLLNDGSPRIELGELPLSLIPAFAVPFWIILHMISLLQLARLRRGV